MLSIEISIFQGYICYVFPFWIFCITRASTLLICANFINHMFIEGDKEWVIQFKVVQSLISSIHEGYYKHKWSRAISPNLVHATPMPKLNPGNKISFL